MGYRREVVIAGMSLGLCGAGFLAREGSAQVT